MSFPRLRTGLATIALLASASVASANELDPSVAQPLNQLLVAATQGCQMGNPQACMIGQQLNMLGNQLFAVQSACEQGDQTACFQFNMAADQLAAEAEAMMQSQIQPQMPTGMTPADQMAYQNQQMALHQQRMAIQQQAFQAHQAQVQQRSALMDQNHQQFLDHLRQ